MKTTKACRLVLCMGLGIATRLVFSSHVIAAEDLHRVRATMIERESSLHTSVDNRDVYRVRVAPQRGRPFDALVVDNFPSYAEALPDYLQREGATFSIELRRTPYCDQSGVDEGKLTRCFSVTHGSWRPSNGAHPDAWWK